MSRWTSLRFSLWMRVAAACVAASPGCDGNGEEPVATESNGGGSTSAGEATEDGGGGSMTTDAMETDADETSEGGGTSNEDFREDCALPAPIGACYNGAYCDEYTEGVPGGIDLAEEACVDTGMQWLEQCPGPSETKYLLGACSLGPAFRFYYGNVANGPEINKAAYDGAADSCTLDWCQVYVP